MPMVSILICYLSADDKTHLFPAYPTQEQQPKSFSMQSQATPGTQTQDIYPGNAYSYPQQSQYPSDPVTANTVVSFFVFVFQDRKKKEIRLTGYL